LPIQTKLSVHNGFLWPAFPNVIKGLANFGHPICFYPSLSHQGREIIAIVALENGAFCTVFRENFHKF
jgi:hypothetical protein